MSLRISERHQVIICLADDKGRAGVVNGTEDSCQGDSLGSLTCLMFQVGHKIAWLRCGRSYEAVGRF
jgi:hypothetical protein